MSDKENVVELSTGEKLTTEEIEKLVAEQRAKDIETVDRIVRPDDSKKKRVIRGENDLWEKDYEYKDLDLKFSISIRVPNAIEQGQIQARREQYLRGMGTFMNEWIFDAYNGLATIREVGVDIPKELEDDERIYNLAILAEINNDFSEWLAQFRY